jgi:uncharacterized protein (TIGR03437 family)
MGGPATAAQFFSPNDLVVDEAGNVYVADGNNRIRKVTTDGTITTIAGSDNVGFGGDGGPASAPVLNSPSNLALDAAGNIFFSDSGNYRIRKISQDGTISTIAGNGQFAYTPDGNPALGSSIWPFALAIDNSGNLLFAESGGVRKINGSGMLSTLVPGNPPAWVAGPAIAVDQSNNVLITDAINNLILMVSPDGVISTIAGNGSKGSIGGPADGPALNANVLFPHGVAVDKAGNIAFSDTFGVRILSAGTVQTIVPTTNPRTYINDGGPSSLSAAAPNAIRVDGTGRIYVVDGVVQGRNAGSSIRLLAPTNQTILIGSVRSAASEAIESVSPGEIVVIYGVGMGPAQLVQNVAQKGVYPKSVGGTQVFFDGIVAPILYASATQVAVVVPYELSATTTSMTIQYGGQTSLPYSLNVAPASPGIFSTNGTGAGQCAAVNADGSINDAAHPARLGDFISLYATGEGLDNPPQIDGKVTSELGPYPRTVLPVNVQVGGISATVTYAGAAPAQIAGLMQVVVQVPAGVQPGGYVPVQLFVGQNATIAGAAWIAVSNK